MDHTSIRQEWERRDARRREKLEQQLAAIHPHVERTADETSQLKARLAALTEAVDTDE